MATEVGQIAIRVKPDTEMFREELLAELEKIEQELSGTKIGIGADFDSDGLAEKVKVAAAEASGEKVKIGTDVSELDRLQERLKAMAENNLRRINFNNLIESQKGGLANNKEYQDIKVRLDWNSLMLEQAKLKAALANEKVGFWADFKGGELVKAKFRLFLTELQGLAKATPIKVNVDVDKDRFARFGEQIANDFVKLGESGAQAFTKLGSGAASGGGSLLSFTSIVLIAVAAIALLIPPVIALAAGLITLAPAMLALTAPAAAVALGLDGIKKAAEDAGLFADSNGDKKGGGGVGAKLKELKDAVSGDFADKLTEPFKQVAKWLSSDELKAGMVTVSTGLSSMISGFTNAISSGKGMEDVNKIIRNVGQGLSNMGPGIESFTNGLLRLIEGISTKFPSIGKWFTDLGNKFSEWATTFTTVPQENGLTGLQNLINNVKIGLDGLVSVFRAFWDQGMKDIQNPNFGEGLKSLFKSLREFVVDILPSLTAGFEQVSAFLDKISPIFRTIGAVTNGLGLFKDAFAGVFSGNMDQNQTFDEMEARFNAARDAGKSFGDAVLESITKIGPKSADSFNQVATNAQNAAKAVADASVAPATGINGKGAPGQPPLTPEELAKMVAGDLANANAAGQQIGSEVNKGITQGVNQPAAGGQSTVAATLSADVQQALQQAQQDIATIGPVLQQTVTQAMTPLMNLPAVIAPAVTGVIQTITVGFSGIPGIIANALGGVVQIVSTTLGSLPAVAANGFTGLVNAATASMTGVVQAVTTGGTQVVQEVSTWPGRLVTAMGDLSAKFQALGAQVGAGLAAGIQANAGAAIAAATKLGNDVEAASKGALGIRSPSKVFTEIGQFVGQGLANGIAGQEDNVVSTITKILEAIKNVFGDNANLNLTLNLGGVQQQAQSATTAVRDFGTAVASVPSTPLTDPSMGAANADTKAQSNELGRQLALLEMQRKQVELQKDAGTISKDQAKAQLDAINNQKTSLGLQKNQLDYAMKYGEQTDQNKGKLSQMYEQIGKAVVGLPQDFAKNVGGQFMNDLGISGDGAIPQLLSQGANYIFQVADMTSALTAHQTLQNRQALQYT